MLELRLCTSHCIIHRNKIEMFWLFLFSYAGGSNLLERRQSMLRKSGVRLRGVEKRKGYGSAVRYSSSCVYNRLMLQKS